MINFVAMKTIHKQPHFDLGAVLIDWNPRYLYRQLFESEEGMEHFLEKVYTPAWNEEQDGGREIRVAEALLIDQFQEYKAEILAFYGRWTEMLGGDIGGTVTILEDLKSRGQHGLYALTNWSAETWPKAVEQFDFLKWFDGILVSGQEKMRNPIPVFMLPFVRSTSCIRHTFLLMTINATSRQHKTLVYRPFTLPRPKHWPKSSTNCCDQAACR